MTLFKRISMYFEHVINYTEFVIAIDDTGVFVFSDADDNDVRLEQKIEGLADVLGLPVEAFVVCAIDNVSGCVYNAFDKAIRDGMGDFVHRVPIDYLEEFIRKYDVPHKYSEMFTPDLIKSVLSCFQDIESNEDTELRAQLSAYVENPVLMDALLAEYTITRMKVIDAGVKAEDVDTVYQLLINSGRHTVSRGQYVNATETTILAPSKMKRLGHAALTVLLIAEVIAAVVLILTGNVRSMIWACLTAAAIFSMRKYHDFERSEFFRSSRVLYAISLLLFLLSVAVLAIVWLPDAIDLDYVSATISEWLRAFGLKV